MTCIGNSGEIPDAV
jgi:aconitate hydratase